LGWTAFFSTHDWDLLNQIAGGVTIYEPLRRNSQDFQLFQDTVHRLQEMERQGLIGK